MIGMTLISLMPILRLVGILWTGRLLRHRRPHWAYWSLSNIHIPYRVGVWPLERISHLSRRRRIMETKKRIRLILAALLSLSWVLPVAATDYEASDYLPLAVGNSWTYKHEFYDIERRYGDKSQWSTYMAQVHDPRRFTITVERTEVIDGKTYYVLSDMPTNWPPAPPHFIAGKKLRWEGTHLMERTANGEEAIYRFDGANEAGYAVSTDEGANQFAVKVIFEPVPKYAFDFRGFEEGGGGIRFVAGYGIQWCLRTIFGTDHPLFENDVKALRAVIGGRSVEFSDALTPTSTSSSSWGEMKQSWLAGEGRGQ